MEPRTKEEALSRARDLLGLVVVSAPKWTSNDPGHRVTEIRALWDHIEKTLLDEFEVKRAGEKEFAKGKKHFVSDSSRPG